MLNRVGGGKESSRRPPPAGRAGADRKMGSGLRRLVRSQPRTLTGRW
jgi:hypothetical protein